jgi:hypothetical protein
VVITNHFQSPELFNDPSNQKYINESPSMYRYRRVEELLSRHAKLTEQEMAAVLRDKKGLGEEDMGMGNEKAVDQMLAHHSIIFNPDHRRFWISCGPYPEGAYVCYDLRRIFAGASTTDETREICESNMEIPADPILGSTGFERFMAYKHGLVLFGEREDRTKNLDNEANTFVQSNPEMYLVYSSLGDYYLWKREFEKAKQYYSTGLGKHIPNLSERKHMESGLKKCSR